MPMMSRRSSHSRAVGHRGEAARRVAREARRDRRVRAVAQQAQRDVHADLRAAAGEQRAAARQVGARLAPRVVARRAVRAELVVEDVDLRVVLLADVTRLRAQQRPALAPRAAGRSGRPCVSSSIRPGAAVAVRASTAASASRTARWRSRLRFLRTVL